MENSELGQFISTALAQISLKFLDSEKKRTETVKLIAGELEWSEDLKRDLSLCWADDESYLSEKIVRLQAQNLLELKQLREYFEAEFSDKKWKHNQKLRALAASSPEGFVPIDYFFKHKRVEKLHGTVERVVLALRESTKLCTSPDKQRVKKCVLNLKNPLIVASTHLDTSALSIKHMKAGNSSDSGGKNELFPLLQVELPMNSVATAASANQNYVVLILSGEAYSLDLNSHTFVVLQNLSNVSVISLQTTGELLIGIQGGSSTFMYNLNSQEIIDSQDRGRPLRDAKWSKGLETLVGTHDGRILTVSALDEMDRLEEYRTFEIPEGIIDFSVFHELYQLVALATGNGSFIVHELSSSDEFYRFRPHLYNTILYSPTITVEFITDEFILTSGQSQNDFSIWSWKMNTQVHHLNLLPFTVKTLAATAEGLLISEIENSYTFFVSIEYIEGLPKFTAIQELNVETENIPLVWSSRESFFNVFGGKLLQYSFSAEPPVDVNSVIREFTNDIAQRAVLVPALDGKLAYLGKLLTNKWNAKRQELRQMCLASAVEAISQANTSRIATALQGVMEELKNQIIGAFEKTLNEFNEKALSSYKELQLININMKMKLENFDSIVSTLYGAVEEEAQRFQYLENYLREILSSYEVEQETNPQDKVNQLLSQGEFQQAILTVVKSPRRLYSVLKVLNPRKLFELGEMPGHTMYLMLKQIVVFPPDERQCPDLELWLEEILKTTSFSSMEQYELKRLIDEVQLTFPGAEGLIEKFG